MKRAALALAALVWSLLSVALAQDAWQTLPLTDARTGETFTLGDLGGTVYVEPMATWCSNCRQQLRHVQAARATLGDGVTFVALSVETTLSNDDLKRYADAHGFEFTFAVMTPEMLRALAAAFGQAALTPPATPHFVLYPDGATTELFTGARAPAEIVALIEP